MSNRQPDADGLIGLGKSFFDLLSPAAKGSVVQWIEKNTEIPVGPIIGNTSLRPTPYLREPLERIGDKKTRHVVLCFGTQAGKTLLMILGMIYRLCRDGQDAMWVLPNGDLAKSFSKSRWQKFVRACKQAAALVPKTHRGHFDKTLFGFTEQHFINMVLNFVGSNSPANLSSRPVGLLWMDETDKYGDQAKYEAAAIQLAEERTKNYPFPLIVKSSTPTWADRMIWQEFLKSDQRHYMLPCPRCEKRIRFQFTVKTDDHGLCGLRWWREEEAESKTDGIWDYEKVKVNSHYRCQECGGEIQEFERPAMLENGVWQPQNPMAEPGRYGYQLSSMYSIISQKTSFSGVAIQWLTAGGNTKERQNFINSWLAEPWDDVRGFDLEDVKTEEFDISSTDGATPIMFIDFQEGHWWALVRRFAPPDEKHPYGESWLTVGERIDTEEQLVAIQKDQGVEGENVLCDMAWRPNQVGAAILRYDWRGIMGAKNTRKFNHASEGHPPDERIYSPMRLRDPHLGTKWQDRTFKRVRYIQYSKHDSYDLVYGLRWATVPCWHISPNVHADYNRHINSRMKLQRFNQKTGAQEWFWKELHHDDHLLDGECAVAIRALQLGLLAVPPETNRMSRG